MSCPTCNSSNFPVFIQNIAPLCAQNCSTTPSCNNSQDIRCFSYLGPNLTCTNITTGLNMEEVVKRLNDNICAVLGDYGTYNLSCLDDSTTIATQKDFVEAISLYACNIRTDLDDFTDSIFPDYQTIVNNRFLPIEVPGIVSASSNILDTDTLVQILTKLAAKITDIYTIQLNISAVDWDECYVATTPTTLAQGFSTLSSEICSLKADLEAAGVTLPTFNNVGSCLPAPLTTADTLVDTINKIKTRLCTVPTFDINTLTWGCTSKPSTTTTNLQDAFQAILTQLTAIKGNLPTFSGQFTVVATDVGNACAGKTVSLSGAAATDRYVASNTADSSPGALDAKLQAGTGITLDFLTTPGKAIITSTATGADEKVKSDSGDPTAGYLNTKIEGGIDSGSGLEITATLDSGAHKMKIGANFGTGIELWNYLLGLLDDNSDLKTAFCLRVMSCLPDCIIPPNVTVVYNTGANTPAAPTSGVVDDTANTFNWTNNPSFTSTTDYEQTLDAGATYTPLSAKPITGLTGGRAIGSVGVRVKAIGTNPHSATLFNTVAYT